MFFQNHKSLGTLGFLIKWLKLKWIIQKTGSISVIWWIKYWAFFFPFPKDLLGTFRSEWSCFSLICFGIWWLDVPLYFGIRCCCYDISSWLTAWLLMFIGHCFMEVSFCTLVIRRVQTENCGTSLRNSYWSLFSLANFNLTSGKDLTDKVWFNLCWQCSLRSLPHVILAGTGGRSGLHWQRTGIFTTGNFLSFTYWTEVACKLFLCNRWYNYSRHCYWCFTEIKYNYVMWLVETSS